MGSVVVFRLSQRTTGHTWWKESYVGGKKQADVVIQELEEVDAADSSSLRSYLSESGYVTVREWQRAIEDQMGKLVTGVLYRIELSNH